MIKIKQYILLLIPLLLTGPVFAFSCQNKQDEVSEKVVIITDRSIYIAGEEVHFLATVFTLDTINDSTQSQVMYAELISPDGNKIGGNKNLIRNSTASGCITIPKDIITGIYYIRAYTKRMRNYGPEAYAYRQVRIINPRRSEVLASENIEQIGNVQEIQNTKPELTDMLTVSSENPKYSPRDSVYLTVRGINQSITQIKSLCLSVVPESTSAAVFLLPKPKEQFLTGKKEYLPETRGISLTGKLTIASSRIPVNGKIVNLSIIGEGRDFMAARTDTSGRFFFSLPDYTGRRDLFLCAEKTPSTDLKIWVDNDFCALPVHLPSPPFALTEQERKIVQNMAVNRQINSFFHNDTLQEIRKEKNEEHAFYGKPSTVLFLDEYILLPTLEEYFNELPGMVKVRKRNNQKYFKVIGSADLSFYNPLVLIDWVAVDEPDRILAVAPQNISRIEIVNQLYIKGGQTYGGIISIISKKGNFGGIDLPSTGIFVNYQFLAENQCIEVIYDTIPAHPDVRNTLLWEPGIIIRNGQSERFIFKAPDTPGKYNIVIEGLTVTGESIKETSSFEIVN